MKIKIAPKAIQNEQKDDAITEELMEPEKEILDPKKFLTPEELESGKLPPEEILSLPMFKVWILNISIIACTIETINFSI